MKQPIEMLVAWVHARLRDRAYLLVAQLGRCKALPRSFHANTLQIPFGLIRKMRSICQ